MIDPRTPVVIGVGQFSERYDDEDYRALSAVELAAHAARAAIANTGADPAAVTARVHTVAGVRQFEMSVPGMPVPLGRSDNFPRSVADRVGATPVNAALEVTGGQSPQKLVNEFAAAIAAGATDAVLLFGAEAISTARHLAGRPDAPDFTEVRGGQLDDRGYGLEGLVTKYMVIHGLVSPASQYGLFENARRDRLGMRRETYARSMGELFAPFTKVASANPHSASSAVYGADELATVTDRNRMIADPYPRLLMARDQVNQGAAVLLTSVGAATELGVPQDRWVFLHGHADLREHDIMDRPDLGASPATVAAAQHALDVAGIGTDDLGVLDLYSCFPIAVSTVADGLGLTADDPRGLTATGGLPYFGGAGNNYSMHAIAEVVARLREMPGSFGFVGANGGMLSKYSAGVYSTTPAPWRPDRSTELQAELDGAPTVATTEQPDGEGTIETYTIRHDRDKLTAIVVGRLPDGSRFLAKNDDGDTELIELLATDVPFGHKVFVRPGEWGNTVTLRPQPCPGSQHS
ncbi:acetyl-CoA acetyltransferase [Aldersonia sp. NBC_00410]|uniref:acetyl-CoA acetyltransferase n=1 Tax=Aldersonia sp. NBC_00410 TaxID=2975954 RepID=UPI0022501D13|nr:acetyl-CoA acetyltransferase [Aldersonia sp. NBC_00410]MCX5045649.1 acetyl-CoA acetyltransferase [Aldersonia sp. NBC_00410]